MISNKGEKKKLLFVLSVDTEEEFDWRGAFPQRNCEVRNVEFLPELHDKCRRVGIRPTYLVDYPVAATADSAAVIRSIWSGGGAEVGAHLHPWCTPPIVGPNTERESHVINLPEDLIREKLQVLKDTIIKNIGPSPTVFRTGRWGVDGKVLRILTEFGFKIDSSVYPYYSNEYFSCLDACDQPYWPDMESPMGPGSQRDILEMPVTSGFNRPNFRFWQQVHGKLSASPWCHLRLVGLAWHAGIIRKLFLSPELSSVADMIDLSRAAIQSGAPVIHMFMHSSTLLEGPTKYNRSRVRRKQLYENISQVVDYLDRHFSIEFCTISEASKRIDAL